MEPPQGFWATLWSCLRFLPFFLGLLLLGIIKGRFILSLFTFLSYRSLFCGFANFLDFGACRFHRVHSLVLLLPLIDDMWILSLWSWFLNVVSGYAKFGWVFSFFSSRWMGFLLDKMYEGANCTTRCMILEWFGLVLTAGISKMLLLCSESFFKYYIGNWSIN